MSDPDRKPLPMSVTNRVEVEIVGVDIGFIPLVAFLLRLMLAAIPAVLLFILLVVVAIAAFSPRPF